MVRQKVLVYPETFACFVPPAPFSKFLNNEKLGGVNMESPGSPGVGETGESEKG